MGVSMEIPCRGIRAKKEQGHFAAVRQLWPTLARFFCCCEIHSHTEVVAAGTHLSAGWEAGCSQHGKGLGTSF